MRAQRGFTLVEALVAAGLAAVAFGGFLDLSVRCLRATLLARSLTVATTVASQALEAHRGCAAPWSPAGTLAEDTPGFVEHLDAGGRPVNDARMAAFTRRWSAGPATGGPSGAIVHRAVAFPRAPGAWGGGAEAPAAVRLVTVLPCR